MAATTTPNRIQSNPSRRQASWARLVRTVALLALSMTLAAHAADQATVIGKVLDSDGEPLAGVRVTIRGGEFEHAATSDKKGRFTATVPDATVRYEIEFVSEGYPVISQPLTLSTGGVQVFEWRMKAPLDATTDNMAALMLFNEAAKAHDEGELDVALSKLEEAVAKDPEFTKAHGWIADIHHVREEHESALVAADRVLALEPDNVAALRIRHLASRALGREDAGDTLDRLAELDRTPQTATLLYNDGVVARAAGNRERALARYELATQINPTFTSALGALAGLYLAEKQYDAALETSARLLELDPENARGLSVRYNTFIALGRNEEAQAMLDELQRAAPGAVAEAFFERGAALFDEGLIDRAIPALEQALEADPNLSQGHYTVALCYLNRGRDEEARRHLVTFLRLAPDDPDADAARRLIEVLGRSD